MGLLYLLLASELTLQPFERAASKVATPINRLSADCFI